MDRPLIIGNVHNLSLEGYSDEQPQLVAQFPCHIEVNTCFYITNKIQLKTCCSTIGLHNVSLFTVKNLTITPKTPNAKGLILHKVVNATIEQIEVYNNITSSQQGIVLMDCHFIQMHSIIARNWEIGLEFSDSNNIYIHNVTASDNYERGMYTFNCSNFHVYSSSFTNNTMSCGIWMSEGHNIVINNNTTEGIHFEHINTAQIVNTIASNNSYIGIYLRKSTNIIISNTTLSHNDGSGIYFLDINTTQIVNTIASNNRHIGIYLWNSTNINISNTTLSHNDEDGLKIAYSSSIHIEGITITDNQNYGIHLYKTKWIYITRFTAIYKYSISKYPGGFKCIIIRSSQYISIYDTILTVNMSVVSSGELISQQAVIYLHKSTLNLSRCTFTGNRITGIKASASNITLSGNLTFSNNSAYTGSAFILEDDSILILTENCRVHFINNHATNTGGVFSVFNSHTFIFSQGDDYDDIPTSNCFLRNQMDDSSTQNFIFSNNSAGKGGDIVYGGHVAYGVNNNKNCMDTFKEISYISDTSLSLISSDPLRVCLCNQSGLPDCMLLVDPTPHSIYPGQTISISAVVVGQDWGTVAGSVYAQFLHKSTLENTTCLKSSQGVQNANKDSCNSLHYTIFSMNENVQQMLVLTTQDFYVSEYQDYHRFSIDTLKYIYSASLSVAQTLYYRTNPVYLNISLLPCPPGFHIRSRKCDCNKLLHHIPGVQCFIQEQTIGRSGLVWVGTIDDDNGTNGIVSASQFCPLNYCNKTAGNVTLSESDSQCRYNHSGTVCGGCQPALSLALGSAQCLSCSNNYLALLIPFTLAGPALVAFIKLLDITISQGTLNGLVFYANIIQDWSIAGLIIILAKHSARLAKVMGNNSVPVLATLFLLSHAKLFSTIITALSYTMLISYYLTRK